MSGWTERADHAVDGVDRQPRQRDAKRQGDGGGVAIGAGAGLPIAVTGSVVDGSSAAARGGIGRQDVASGLLVSVVLHDRGTVGVLGAVERGGVRDGEASAFAIATHQRRKFGRLPFKVCHRIDRPECHQLGTD